MENCHLLLAAHNLLPISHFYCGRNHLMSVWKAELATHTQGWKHWMLTFLSAFWKPEHNHNSLGYSDARALNLDGKKQGGSGWSLSQWQQWISRTSSFWFFSGALSVQKQWQWNQSAQHPRCSSCGIMSSQATPHPFCLYTIFSGDLPTVLSPWSQPISEPSSPAFQVILWTIQNPILLVSATDNFWHLPLR